MQELGSFKREESIANKLRQSVKQAEKVQSLQKIVNIDNQKIRKTTPPRFGTTERETANESMPPRPPHINNPLHLINAKRETRFNPKTTTNVSALDNLFNQPAINQAFELKQQLDEVITQSGLLVEMQAHKKSR